MYMVIMIVFMVIGVFDRFLATCNGLLVSIFSIVIYSRSIEFIAGPFASLVKGFVDFDFGFYLFAGILPLIGGLLGWRIRVKSRSDALGEAMLIGFASIFPLILTLSGMMILFITDSSIALITAIILSLITAVTVTITDYYYRKNPCSGNEGCEEKNNTTPVSATNLAFMILWGFATLKWPHGTPHGDIYDPYKILEFIEQQKVVYERQVQVALEDYMEHRTTRIILQKLVTHGKLSSFSEKYRFNNHSFTIRWFYLPSLKKEEVESEIRKKIELIKYYLLYEGRYEILFGIYADYAEYLVEQAFRAVGCMVVSKYTNYFNGITYTRKDTDLDFIVFHRDVGFIGVEVKNKLDYPELKDIEDFLDLVNYLGLKPLFVARMMPRRYIWEVISNGGFVVITERYLLKPGMPHEVFNGIVNMGIPLGIYRENTGVYPHP